MNPNKSMSQKADELEFQKMQELGDLMIYKSQIHKLAEGEWSEKTEFSLGPLKPTLMGEDLRLPNSIYYKVQHLHKKTAYPKKWC